MKAFLLLLLSLIFILQTFPPASSLNYLCKAASENNTGIDYDLCLTILHVCNKNSPYVSHRILIHRAARLARDNFTSTKNKIDGTRQLAYFQPPSGDDERAALRTCSTNYANGITHINSAIYSINFNDLLGAANQMRPATEGVRQCMAVLDEIKMKKPILEEENKNAVGLTSFVQFYIYYIQNKYYHQ